MSGTVIVGLGAKASARMVIGLLVRWPSVSYFCSSLICGAEREVPQVQIVSDALGKGVEGFITYGRTTVERG
jgi:hypothetical protein